MGLRPLRQSITPGCKHLGWKWMRGKKHLGGHQAWLEARGGCASTRVPRRAPHLSENTAFNPLSPPWFARVAAIKVVK